MKALRFMFMTMNKSANRTQPEVAKMVQTLGSLDENSNIAIIYGGCQVAGLAL
jgi:hypothetical protein